MQRLRFLVWKEFLELKMDPRLFGLVFIAPILQLTMLGYAATTDVRDVPVVVADGDRSPESRGLIGRFEASRNFSVIDVVSTNAAIDPYLEKGTAWLAVSIPAGYGADVAAHRSVTLQLVADGSDANSTRWRSATRRDSSAATCRTWCGSARRRRRRRRSRRAGSKGASASGSTRSSRAGSS